MTYCMSEDVNLFHVYLLPLYGVYLMTLYAGFFNDYRTMILWNFEKNKKRRVSLI